MYCLAVNAFSNTGANFLKLGVGAKAIGMGSAFTSVANDVSSIYWNPAGLSQLHQSEFFAMHTKWITDMQYQVLGFGYPTSIGTFGASIFYLSKGELERRGENRELLGNFSAYDLATTISYSCVLSSNSNLGVNLRFIIMNLDEKTATGMALDIGYLTTFLDNLKVGFVIQHLGTKMNFINESFLLPLTTSFGISYVLFDVLTISSDFRYILYEEKAQISVGVEYRILNFLFLRVGHGFIVATPGNKNLFINQNGISENLAGIGIGVGLKVSNYQFDYALIPYGVLGNTHRISFAIRFE
jgi:hypothetical protein